MNFGAFGSASRRDRILLGLLVFLTLVAAGLRNVPYITAPLDDSTEDRESVAFVGEAIGNWDRFGFRAHLGRPIVVVDPVDRPGISYYLNHPPALFWISYLATRILGKTELALRIFPALAAAISIALTVALVGRRAGKLAALACAVIYLTNRSGMFFGFMANYESPVLAFILAAIYLRERMNSGAREWPVLAALFFGMWFDWAAAFGTVALGVYEMFQPREDRSYARWARFLMASVVGGMSVFVLLAVWTGSVVAAADVMRSSSASTSMTAHGMPGFSEWIKAQKSLFLALHGRWLFIAGLTGFCGIVVHLAADRVFGGRRSIVVAADSKGGRLHALARLAICLIVPGILNVVVFPRRAFDHEFWWYYANSGIVVAAVYGLLSLKEVIARLPIRAGAVAAGGGVIVIVLSGTIAYDGYKNARDRRLASKSELRKKYGEIVNLLVPADAVLLSPFAASSERYYIKCFVFSPTDKFEHLSAKGALEIWRAGRFENRETVVYLPNFLWDAEPDIEDYCTRQGVVKIKKLLPGRFVFLPRLSEAPPFRPKIR